MEKFVWLSIVLIFFFKVNFTELSEQLKVNFHGNEQWTYSPVFFSNRLWSDQCNYRWSTKKLSQQIFSLLWVIKVKTKAVYFAGKWKKLYFSSTENTTFALTDNFTNLFSIPQFYFSVSLSLFGYNLLFHCHCHCHGCANTP